MPMNTDPYSDQTVPNRLGPYPQFRPDPGQFGPSPKLPLGTRLWRWYRRQRNARKVGIGCGVLVVVMALCGTCGAIVNATNPQPSAPAQKSPAMTKTPTPTPTRQPIATPTMVPTSA